MLNTSQDEIRRQFREGDEDQLEENLKHGKEVAEFLRSNVVQGKLEEEGKYSKLTFSSLVRGREAES